MTRAVLPRDGSREYCEYPANFIRIMQRFVFGIDLRLDGSLAISPTAAGRSIGNKGFGQVLVWPQAADAIQNAGKQDRRQFRGLFTAEGIRKITEIFSGTGVNSTIDGLSVDVIEEDGIYRCRTCLLPGRITDMKFACLMDSRS